MVSEIRIGDRIVGLGHPCFVIAEAGVNHNGDINTARKLIDIAKDTGADAVKFQTFKVEKLVSVTAPKAEYQIETTDPDESQADTLKRLELSPDMHRELQTYCKEREIMFLSTPFDRESVDLLSELDVPLYKIGSGDITNWPLLNYIARKGKPIILSTGMAHMSEVKDAVKIIRSTGNYQLALLHCVSNYPAEPGDVNLRAMQTLEMEFNVPVGYSDHTVGKEVALAAVGMGASIIEKHFTVDKNLPGPDQNASLEPQELVAFIEGIRTVEAALGTGIKEPAQSEEGNRLISRRSLAAANDIPESTIVDSDMLKALRPASGIAPSQIDQVIGRKTRHTLAANQLISWSDLE